MTAFFQILSNSSLIKHPTVGRYILKILTALLNSQPNKSEVIMAVTTRVAAS
jgi:hypothetical protein